MRGKKNYMVLVRARTTFASRTTNFFYFFIQHFSFCFCRKKDNSNTKKEIKSRTLLVQSYPGEGRWCNFQIATYTQSH